MKRSIVLLACLSIAASLGHGMPTLAKDSETPADLQIPRGLRACSTHARAADQDINGVAVRKGPAVSAPLIAMLPAMRTGLDGKSVVLSGAELRVIGTDGHGWFLIEDASYQADDDDNAQAGRTIALWGSTGDVYAGRGWVHGSRLQTDIVSSNGLHGAALAASAVAVPLHVTDDDEPIRASLLDCDGSALRLRITLSGRAMEGWIIPGQHERICANQRTTCV